MITNRTCPQCQHPLAADAPDGLCPQCLMAAASGPPPSAAGVGLPADIIDIGDPAEVAKKLPQFEILELLGRGGMGVVYKARQLQLDRLVALKILPPVDALSADFVARFTREARALAKLNHPNIVNVYDFGETGGLYYIVMEYVEGANLRQLFEARKLTSAEALAIVPKICDALQYAHEEGLVHRDIKPENLLIDKKGRVKIADFGLAKLLRREPLDMTLTLSGMALGTLRYMAPEQMDKPETVDHRADLYSLGVVIYEMLTGETPVGRFELPSQKAQVDVRFDEIVLHALEREPDRRYQHASEVRDDVEKVTSSPNVAQASPPVGQAGILPAVRGTAGGTPADPTDWKSVPQPPAPQPGGGAEDAEEDAEENHSVFTAWGGRIIALVAVLLAFFNPWGTKAWYFFAAGCAIFGVLSAFGFGRRAARMSEAPADARSTRHLLSAFLVLLCLFGFFFGFSFHRETKWTAVGQTTMITVGALDPLFVSERGTNGSQTSFDFFSWSFLAVVVAGMAFSALWRVGREDQGKVPRDPAWWRDWWTQAGIWGGLLLTACIVRTALHPEVVLQPPSERTVRAHFNKVREIFASGRELSVRSDRSQVPASTSPGREDYAFTFKSAPDHAIEMWLEFWRDGRVEIETGFSDRVTAKAGVPFAGTLHLTMMDGDVASVESAGQTRFDWQLDYESKAPGWKGDASKSSAKTGTWRPNQLKSAFSRTTTWDEPRAFQPQPGETVTLLALCGFTPPKREISTLEMAWDETTLRQGWPTSAIILRARFVPVQPGELVPVHKKAAISAKEAMALPWKNSP